MALVRRAQSSLADLGYEIGDIDGVIGSRTRKALSDMASKLGMPPLRQVDLALVEKLETAVVDQPTTWWQWTRVVPGTAAGPDAGASGEPAVTAATAPGHDNGGGKATAGSTAARDDPLR